MRELRPGDVGFVMHHDNRLSRVIAWFMGSRWSHSFMVLEVTDRHTYLVETTDTEVTHSTLDKYLSDQNVSMEVWTQDEMTDADRLGMSEVARGEVGKLYGLPFMLGLGLRRLLMRVGIKIRPPFRSQDVCCTVPLVGLCAKSPAFSDIKPHEIDTQDLYDRVAGSGQFRLALSKPQGQ